MKVCSKCGAENADAANFCGSCASPMQQTGGRTCPSGKHTMDPSWTECPYCKQDNATPAGGPTPVRRPTVVEGGPLAPRSGPGRVTQREDAPLTPRPPRVVPSPPASGGAPAGGAPSGSAPAGSSGSAGPSSAPSGRARAHTEFRLPTNGPAGPASGPASNPGASSAPAVAKDRKIVGILVTYSWAPEGQVFPVREGRNFIGRDSDCEISVPDDTTMSGRNSHVTYRQSFVIGDMVSMTGTDINGVPIEEQFRSLPNYATVRAGSTYFTFIAIAPPRTAGAVESSGVSPETAPAP
jgi:hypothetical protein